MLEGSKSHLAKIDVSLLVQSNVLYSLSISKLFIYDLFTSVLSPHVPIAHRNCSHCAQTKTVLGHTWLPKTHKTIYSSDIPIPFSTSNNRSLLYSIQAPTTENTEAFLSAYKTRKIGSTTSQTPLVAPWTSSLSVPNCNAHCRYSSWLSIALSLADSSLLSFTRSFIQTHSSISLHSDR